MYIKLTNKQAEKLGLTEGTKIKVLSEDSSISNQILNYTKIADFMRLPKPVQLEIHRADQLLKTGANKIAGFIDGKQTFEALGKWIGDQFKIEDVNSTYI